MSASWLHARRGLPERLRSRRGRARQIRDHSLAGERGNHAISKVEFTAEDIKKGDYPHYMLKEIFEHPARFATRCAVASASKSVQQS